VRRRSEAGTVRIPGIRKQLLAEGVFPEYGDRPFVDKERLLRDGEAVEVNALELPPLVRRCAELGFEPFDRLRIEPDDTVVIVALQPAVPPLPDAEPSLGDSVW
jgi:hypothetical protein